MPNTFTTYEPPDEGTYTLSEMKGLYKRHVYKTSISGYCNFEDWLHDMLRSGVFEEDKQ